MEEKRFIFLQDLVYGVIASFVIILLTVSYMILTLTFYILTGSCIWCNSFIRHHTANSVLQDLVRI
jgi:hypothetical protein